MRCRRFLVALALSLLVMSASLSAARGADLWELARQKQDVHRFSTWFPAQSVRDDLATDAGIDAGQVGLASAPSQVSSFATKPPRSAGQVVKDEGDGGVKIAEFLASQKLV